MFLLDTNVVSEDIALAIDLENWVQIPVSWISSARVSV
jgi:hypothetical protein